MGRYDIRVINSNRLDNAESNGTLTYAPSHAKFWDISAPRSRKFTFLTQALMSEQLLTSKWPKMAKSPKFFFMRIIIKKKKKKKKKKKNNNK